MRPAATSRLRLVPASGHPASGDPASARGYDPVGYHPVGYDPVGYDPVGYDPVTDLDTRLLDGVAWYAAADRSLQAGPPADLLGDHLNRYGHRPSAAGAGGTRLLEDLTLVGLAGRGGAWFPVARKWGAVLDAGGGGVVVANGAESEPASAKDAALLQHRPHLVLDGLVCAAEALGARSAVVWLHEGATETRRALARALAERRADAFDDPPIEIATGPHSYLTGESSAVVSGLEGGLPLPRFRDVPAARSGVHGMPTLVQNVETLARVGLLARTGPGTAPPGTLLTVVRHGLLGVAEIEAGTTVAGVASWAGLLTPGAGRPSAVLVGGFGGRWARWDDVAALPVAHLDSHRGPSVGAGVLAVAGEAVCGLAETAAVARYLADSSARQCGPCLHGTRDLAAVLARIAAGTPRRTDRRDVTELAGELRGRGACGLPDAAAELTASALEVFAEDVQQHLARRPCDAARAGAALLPVPGRQP